MKMQRKLGLAAALGVAVVLGGCFGDDDNNAPSRPVLTTAPTPADIGTTSESLVAYVQRLVNSDAAQADLAEPVDISGVDLQTSETDEPREI